MIDYFRTILTAIAYRIRGGGWFTFGSNVPCRVIWGAAMGLSYGLHGGDDVYLFLIPVLAYASMYVPHAYAQNMGRWPFPQKKWPSWFMPDITLETWAAWPMWKRTCYDALNMACIGFMRGMVVFAPFAMLDIVKAILAVAIITVLQPLSYYLGHLVPFKFTNSLRQETTEWCEFLNGAAWSIAVMAL